MKRELVRVRKATEATACEEVTQPVVLVAPYEGATSVTVYKVHGDVGQIRVQMPMGSSDMIMHVEVASTGEVKVYARKRKWSDKPEFLKLHRIDVLEDLQMQRLAK